MDWYAPLPASPVTDLARSLIDVSGRVDRPVAARMELTRQLSRVLADPATAARVQRSGVRVVVIPRTVPVTEVTGLTDAAHAELLRAQDGQPLRGVRGVTAPDARLVLVAEENLLGENADIDGQHPFYPDGYSTVMHELAHMVYQFGLSEHDRDRVRTVFEAKVEAGPDTEWADGPRRNIEGALSENYSSLSPEEYFAQTTNAYLGANHGRDPLTGRERNNGADWVRAHEEPLVPLLQRLYGADPDPAPGLNPVARTRAENDLWQGFRDFTALVQASSGAHLDRIVDVPQQSQKLSRAQTGHRRVGGLLLDVDGLARLVDRVVWQARAASPSMSDAGPIPQAGDAASLGLSTRDCLVLLVGLGKALHPPGEVFGSAARLRAPSVIRPARVVDDLVVGTGRAGDVFAPGGDWGRVTSWERLADAVRDAGPGAAALVLVQRSRGLGHAFAAYHTTDQGVVWVEPQAPAGVRVGRGEPSLAEVLHARAVVVDPGGRVIADALPWTSAADSTARALSDPPTDHRYGMQSSWRSVTPRPTGPNLGSSYHTQPVEILQGLKKRMKGEYEAFARHVLHLGDHVPVTAEQESFLLTLVTAAVRSGSYPQLASPSLLPDSGLRPLADSLRKGHFEWAKGLLLRDDTQQLTRAGRPGRNWSGTLTPPIADEQVASPWARRQAPWSRTGAVPYPILTLGPRGKGTVRVVDGESREYHLWLSEFATLVAHDPALREQGSNVVIVLAGSNMASGGLWLPRMVAARSQRIVWSHTSLVSHVPDQGDVLLTAVFVQGVPTGNWVIARPEDLGPDPDPEGTARGFTSPFAYNTIVDAETGEPNGGSSIVSQTEYANAFLGLVDTYQIHSKASDGSSSLIPGSERPLPWVVRGEEPYFYAAHGNPSAMQLAGHDGVMGLTTDRVANVDAHTVSKMLLRRPSLSRLRGDGPPARTRAFVMLVCEAGALPQDADRLRVLAHGQVVANHLAGGPYNKVYAPNRILATTETPQRLILTLEAGGAGEPTWVEFVPEPTRSRLDRLKDVTGLRPKYGWQEHGSDGVDHTLLLVRFLRHEFGIGIEEPSRSGEYTGLLRGAAAIEIMRQADPAHRNTLFTESWVRGTLLKAYQDSRPAERADDVPEGMRKLLLDAYSYAADQSNAANQRKPILSSYLGKLRRRAAAATPLPPFAFPSQVSGSGFALPGRSASAMGFVGSGGHDGRQRNLSFSQQPGPRPATRSGYRSTRGPGWSFFSSQASPGASGGREPLELRGGGRWELRWPSRLPYWRPGERPSGRGTQSANDLPQVALGINPVAGTHASNDL
ncbi:lonely Cys domain-containing protein [Streptomyces sp. NPDC020681]|uniref:lonely Cys domain-containing protein n=1 Tax=Streptomyces sp. NPDC020681 TaxID=3365083 RepID=UPI0037B08AAB